MGTIQSIDVTQLFVQTLIIFFLQLIHNSMMHSPQVLSHHPTKVSVFPRPPVACIIFKPLKWTPTYPPQYISISYFKVGVNSLNRIKQLSDDRSNQDMRVNMSNTLIHSTLREQELKSCSIHVQ